MRLLSILILLAGVALADIALWALPNQPHALEPPPGGKLRSVSFAPFRDGQSPLAESYPSAAEIDEDLRLLKDETFSVRTYTSREGLEVVPKLARQYGLKVIQGTWIGPKPKLNDAEIESTIKLANEYPDVIDRVIVGNEVLLRGDRTVDQLIAAIRRVKAAVRQPVTYADVWEWWLKYPQVAQEVDFITIHLLPYWEDVPAGIDDVEARIEETYDQIHQRFPDKPILIGEVGWPTAGRSRGPAVPSLVNKARFINGFVRLAQHTGFDYNIIEAFDQSWKAASEGTVGANWGLFSTDRTRKFDLAGPVAEDPRWKLHCAVSIGLAALLFAAALAGRPGVLQDGAGLGRIAGTAMLAQGLASALVLAGTTAIDLTYFPFDKLFSGLMLALQAVLALALVRAATAPDAPPAPALRSLGAALGDLAKPGCRLASLGSLAAAALTILAVALNFLLIVDGRYRDFPVPDYLVPALGIAGLAALRLGRPGCAGPVGALAIGHLFGPSGPPETPAGGGRGGFRAALALLPLEAVLALLTVLGAVTLVFSEGLGNHEALTWAGLQLMLALPYAAAVLRAAGLPAATIRTAAQAA